jgi:hypothetical protein
MTNPDLAMFATGVIDQLLRFGAARHRPIDRAGDVIEVEAREWDAMLKAAVKARDSAEAAQDEAPQGAPPAAVAAAC